MWQVVLSSTVSQCAKKVRRGLDQLELDSRVESTVSHQTTGNDSLGNSLGKLFHDRFFVTLELG